MSNNSSKPPAQALKGGPVIVPKQRGRPCVLGTFLDEDFRIPPRCTLGTFSLVGRSRQLCMVGQHGNHADCQAPRCNPPGPQWHAASGHPWTSPLASNKAGLDLHHRRHPPHYFSCLSRKTLDIDHFRRLFVPTAVSAGEAMQGYS